MIYDFNKAPYIREVFRIIRPTFSNQIAHCNISAKVSTNLQGHNADLKISEVIKPAIGEFIERQSLYYNYKKSNDYMKAFRLVNGKEITFPAEKIVFVRNGNFSDSCGVASHLNSRQTIENAFLEFFERQSFIYNWLTKSNGRLIKLANFKTGNISVYHKILMEFVDEIYLFEISLNPIIKVVFGLGVGVHHKTVGLSAAFTIDEAISSTLQEMVQVISHKHNKYSVDFYDESMNFEDEDIYIQNFEKRNPEQLLAEYNYLLTNGKKYEEDKVIDNNDLISIINTIESSLGIKIYCALIPCFYKGFRSKIVKVFSPEGYPHMSPPEFKRIEEWVIYGKKISECPNYNRDIPFP